MVMISMTGEGHGWGSDPYKWVSRLTEEERAAVRRGELVFITGCPASARGIKGVYVRKVIWKNGRYVHRVPETEEVEGFVDFVMEGGLDFPLL